MSVNAILDETIRLSQERKARLNAVTAIAAWERAWLAYRTDDDALSAAENAAHNAVCEIVAATPAELAAQLRFARTVFSDGRNVGAPEDDPLPDLQFYGFSQWTNGRDARLLANLTTAAAAIAEKQHAAVQRLESLHEAWLEVEGLVRVFDALTDTLDPCGPGCREVTAISYTISRVSKAFSRRMADTVIACGGKA